jgi:catalase
VLRCPAHACWHRYARHSLAAFSVGGDSPHGLNKARLRRMALELNSDNDQQGRMAMTRFPFFGVSSAQAFYEQTVANAPCPATG